MTHFGTHLLDFLKGKCTSHQPLGVFTPIFCDDVCLLQEHQNTNKHVIWCSG